MGPDPADPTETAPTAMNAPADPPTASQSPRPRAPRWVVALVWCWLLVLGAVYAHIPPSPDQDELDYVAERMNAGDRPYIDVVDMNWPGSVWIHQLARLLPEGRAHPWRLVDYAFILIGAWSAWGFLAGVPPSLRASAAAVYPVLSITAGSAWFAGQRDAVVGHLALAAGLVACRTLTRHPAWGLAAGAIVGSAVLIKPTSILAAFAIAIIVAIWSVTGRRLGAGIAWLALAAVAGVVTLGAALAITLAQGSDMHAVRACLIDYNTIAQHFESKGPAELVRIAAAEHARSWHWITLFALLGITILARGRDTRPAAVLLALLWVAGMGAYAWQSKGYTYHLAQAFAPLSTLGLIGAVGAIGLIRVRKAMLLGLGALALVGAGTLAKVSHLRAPAMYALGATAPDAFLASYPAGDGMNRAQALDVVESIRNATDPDDTIFLWGTASMLNLRADRAQCTRFYYAPVLINARDPMPIAAQWIREFHEDLRANPPAFCVINRPLLDRCADLNPPVAARIEELLKNYTYVRTVGDAEIYE